MNRRQILIAAAVVAGSAAAFATPDERSGDDRWEGAWVLTRMEVFSDCAGGPTLNRFDGERIHGDGRQGFGPGELARVRTVEWHEGGLRVDLELPEPILVSRRDGPFTLYDEAFCAVRLRAESPIGGTGGAEGAEPELRDLLLWFPSESAARTSSEWNRRRRGPYPPGYERTLLDHTAWMVEKVNEKVRGRFERVMRETSRVADRMNGDADYRDGFFEGVRTARSIELDDCREIGSFDLDAALKKAVKLYRKNNSHRSAAARDGYRDGHIMVYGMKILGRMPECMMSVAEAVESRASDPGSPIGLVKDSSPENREP